MLEVYGVRRKPGLIRCAGAAEVRVGDKIYALEDFAPAAHLRMRDELPRDKGPDIDSARALIDAILDHGVKLEQERY